MAMAAGLALQVMGLNKTIFSALVPDFALVLAAMGTLLCLSVALLVWARARRSFVYAAGTGNGPSGGLAPKLHLFGVLTRSLLNVNRP